MTAYLALLLLVSGITVLRDDVNTIPAGEWRYAEFTIGPKLPVDLECNFRVDEPSRARVELVSSDNLRAFLKGEEHEAIATSTSGAFHQEIGVPGRFALVIRNLEESRSARVAMRVTLDTTGQSLVKAKYLSPQRKLLVILSSFVGFLLIVTVSARKLLLAMRR